MTEEMIKNTQINYYRQENGQPVTLFVDENNISNIYASKLRDSEELIVTNADLLPAGVPIEGTPDALIEALNAPSLQGSMDMTR